MALPERLCTRFKTTTSVIIISAKPAVKLAMAVVPVAPCAPFTSTCPPLGEAEIAGALRAGGVENNVQAVCVMPDYQAVDELLDYLAEGQRHDGEVVAAQAQDGDADYRPGGGRAERAHGERDGEAQRA